jgi:hypothetical protein
LYVTGTVYEEFSCIAGDAEESKELLVVISCSFDCYEYSNVNKIRNLEY